MGMRGATQSQIDIPPRRAAGWGAVLGSLALEPGTEFWQKTGDMRIGLGGKAWGLIFFLIEKLLFPSIVKYSALELTGGTIPA